MKINHVSINNNVNEIASSKKKEKMVEKMMNIKEDDLSKIMFDKDVIITLNLENLITNAEQYKLVAKFHAIDDCNFAVNNVQLFKKKGNALMGGTQYQLGIDFRKVFFAKDNYFNFDMMQYIASCKSYAIKAFENLFDQVFDSVRVEQIMDDFLCDVEYSMKAHIIDMDFHPIAHYCLGFEIDNLVNKETYDKRVNQQILDLKRSTPIDLEIQEMDGMFYTTCFAYGIRGGHILFNRDVVVLKDFEYFKYIESDKIVDLIRKFFDVRDIDIKGVEEHNSTLLMDKILKKYSVNILAKLADHVMLPNLDKTLYDYLAHKMRATCMIHHVFYTMR